MRGREEAQGMDVFERLFRRTKAAVILMGVALLVLGVAMFVSPIGATLAIVQIAGWTLVIVGAVTLLNCWAHRSAELRQADLVIGLIELVPGALLVTMPEAFVAVVYVLIGVIIMVTGVNDVAEAGAVRRLGLPGAGWRFVLGVLTLAAGAFVVASPFAMAEFVMLVAGLALVFDGITEIVAGVRMR